MTEPRMLIVVGCARKEHVLTYALRQCGLRNIDVVALTGIEKIRGCEYTHAFINERDIEADGLSLNANQRGLIMSRIRPITTKVRP